MNTSTTTPTTIQVDVAQFARDIKAGKGIGGADGALSFLIKQLTEAALAAEIDSHLAQDLQKNRRNGYTSKTMKRRSSRSMLWATATPRSVNISKISTV